MIKLLVETRKHRPQAVEQVIQFEYIYKIVSKYLDNNYILDKDIEKNIINIFCKIPENDSEHIINHHTKKINCDTYDYYMSYDATNYSCGYDSKKENTKIDTEKYCLDYGYNIKKNRYDSNPASKKYRLSLCNNNIQNNEPLKDTKRECYINADLMLPLIIKGDICYIIATQAPIQSTINDFKQMIRMHNVNRIIMLTRLYEEINNDNENNNDNEISIKQKADDYINISASFENKYKDTYFDTKISSYENSNIIEVLSDLSDVKIGKINKENWFNSYICDFKKN
jgi:protein tyrosine phosphatase